MMFTRLKSVDFEEKRSRLDPRFHLSRNELKKYKFDLKEVDFSLLSDLTTGSGISYPGRNTREYVPDPRGGVPFLSSTRIFNAELLSVKHISKSQSEKIPELLLNVGDILVTRSGNTGEVQFVDSRLSGCAASEHLMRIKPDYEKIESGYLYAILRTKFGKLLLSSETYASIIRHIEPEHIENIKIPMFDEKIRKNIDKHIQLAMRLRLKYKTAIEKAENLLFESMDISNDDILDVVHGNTHNFDRNVVVDSRFFRPSNFLGPTNQIKKVLSRCKTMNLEDVVVEGSLKRGPRFKRQTAEIGTRMIGQRHILWIQPRGQILLKGSMPEGVFVKEKTILVCAQGGADEGNTFGRCRLISNGMTQMAFSEHFLRVNSDNTVLHPEVLFVFLRSEIGYRLLLDTKGGSILQEFVPELLKKLPIAIPPKDIQLLISKHVQDAVTSLDKSVIMETDAIEKLETLLNR